MSTQCVGCTIGKYQLLAGKGGCDECTNCSVNEIETVSCQPTVNRICTPCSLGSTYKSDEITCSLCAECSNGEQLDAVCTQSQNTKCMECDVGKYRDTLVSTKCVTCTIGKYQLLEGKGSCDECTNCDVNEIETVSCQPTVNSIRTPCILGSTYKSDVTTCSLCAECSNGEQVDTVCTQSQNTRCIQCDVGKYGNVLVSTECVTCTIGKYQSLSGKGSCDDCSNCSVSSQQSTACTQFNDTECTFCEAGKYRDILVSTECVACTIGTYQSLTGKGSCDECANCSIDNQQSTACTEVNDTMCTLCEVGKYHNVSGSNNCGLCLAGECQSLLGQTHCEKCVSGKYQENTGSERCIQCPLNSFSQVGSIILSSCMCKKGFTGPNGEICNKCETSKYKDSIGSEICLNCPAGKFLFSRSDSVSIDNCTAKIQTLISFTLNLKESLFTNDVKFKIRESTDVKLGIEIDDISELNVKNASTNTR